MALGVFLSVYIHFNGSLNDGEIGRVIVPVHSDGGEITSILSVSCVQYLVACCAPRILQHSRIRGDHATYHYVKIRLSSSQERQPSPEVDSVSELERLGVTTRRSASHES